MHPSGHRAIGALAVLLAILMGVLALLPLVALGATSQVTGLVSVCGTTTYVAGATVTLIDTNAINSPQTTTTNGAGVYAFTPPTGSYTLAVNRTAYYGNATSSPVRFDGSRTVGVDLCMYAFGTPNKVLTVNVLSGGSPISGATVAAYNVTNPTGKVQLVTAVLTNAAGYANLTLWSAQFQLRTSARDYATDQSNVDLSVSTTATITLVAGNELVGHARDSSGNFVGSNLVGWLYDPTAPSSSARRLIPAVVNSSLFDFHAPSGTYTVIIDADGYLAYEASVTLPRPNPYDVVLSPAPRERYETTVLYGAQDWSNLTVWRNITLNPDSTLTGLAPANLRDLRLQIDATLGNGDGSLSSAEITSFSTWLTSKGPAYVTTDAFFLTNGRGYNSTASSFSVTVSPTLGIANAKVWINATARYGLKQAPPYIATGAKTYFVNVTMVPDSNTSGYQDYVYVVSLPKRYELNTSSTVPSTAPVTLSNFTRITIDPGVMPIPPPPQPPPRPQVRMTISESLNGTARAKVTGPTGKFYESNKTFTNYQAFVASNTSLTFSAGDSFDPNGHIADANFTWRFTTNPADVRYGIGPNFTYRQAATFTVNLTVKETGGNLTYRDITLYVDDRLPIARIRTNRSLLVDEGITVRFDGALSTDLAYVGKNGVILDSGYSWDFNGDRIADATGRIVNKTFQTPGQFTVNLTVTDSVGWKSANASMTAIVNDTKAPVPRFDILDPAADWAVITSPMERKTIVLNASKSTDDYDKVATLNFTWTVLGPLTGYVRTNNTFWGPNITFAWQEWNNTYNVSLSVRDTGFPSTRNKPNYGNVTRRITVTIDTSIHADLQVVANTMKVTPTDPEEGAPVTVSVNVTNVRSRGHATSVVTQLRAISGGVTTILTDQADWFDKNGTSKDGNHTILSGETVTLVFHVTLTGQGNKTLQVYFYDATEPYTWITGLNRPQSTVNVRQPWWQPYAIYGSVIGVIILFVFGMYARRKIKAGEWRPVRGRRAERGEEEEKRPRKEIKEEKKRL